MSRKKTKKKLIRIKKEFQEWLQSGSLRCSDEEYKEILIYYINTLNNIIDEICA